jgi:hypothetical protein
MMSSTTPSVKYSCSMSPLRFRNGSAAIEGLSGRAGASAMVLAGASGPVLTAAERLAISLTSPTNRNPLRAIVRSRRWFCPLSPMALRAALM